MSVSWKHGSQASHCEGTSSGRTCGNGVSGVAAGTWLGCEWICVYWGNLLFWAEKKGVEMGNGREKKLMGGGQEENKMLEKMPGGNF